MTVTVSLQIVLVSDQYVIPANYKDAVVLQMIDYLVLILVLKMLGLICERENETSTILSRSHRCLKCHRGEEAQHFPMLTLNEHEAWA